MYVNVPQTYVPQSSPARGRAQRAGDPGSAYAATVEASSQSVNAGSGTTLMQLVVDNADGELLPGGYANVRLDLPATPRR